MTGCDSSSDSHSINKLVGDKTFDVGGLTLDPNEEGTITENNNVKTYSIDFTLKNPSTSVVYLYNDAAAIYYKGHSLPVTIKVQNTNNGWTPVSKFPIRLGAETAVTVEFSCTVPTDTDIKDIIVKLHYNDKSIKFQNTGSEFKTSGVYTDKIKV